MTSAANKANETSLHDNFDDEASVELEFEAEEQDTSIHEDKQSQPPTVSPVGNTFGAGNSTPSDSSGSGSSYEIVNEAVINIDENESEDLDDLEAEIARELGDD